MEVGRWRGLKREEGKSTDCDSVEVEDVKYFLMRCKALNREREELTGKKKKVVTGLAKVEEERNVARIGMQKCVHCKRSGEIVDSEVCTEV